MSLLMSNTNVRLTSIARKVFDKHFELDPKLDSEYDDRRKRLMYEDILYNLGYLDTALTFEDGQIFTDYAVWIYQLLCYIMKDIERNRIKDQMVMHFNLLSDALLGVIPEEKAALAADYIRKAIRVIEREALEFSVPDTFQYGKYVDLKKKYLELLLENDTKGAYHFIEDLHKSGYKLEDIYIDIIQEVMHEVGDLWHQQKLSVDKEHYCTSTTQMVLSQFYPLIFSTHKNGCKLLACSVGSELHEMGARMVSDLFEYHGWESIYLGTAIPTDAVVKAIKEHAPDMIALSVTMPQHLSMCFEMVCSIREAFGDIIIAVGGKGFETSDNLWKKWDVDISTDNALNLVEWANKNIVDKKIVVNKME